MDQKDLSPGQRIRRRREEQGLTWQALATAADLDTATVRRIAQGAFARCEEALALAKALDFSADDLFDGVFARLQQFASNAQLTDTAWNDAVFREQIAKCGIDIHPAVWFLKIRLRGGWQGTFFIAAPDLDRFHKALAEKKAEDSPFVVFHSRQQAIAINLKEVVYAHALFEGVGVTPAAQDTPQNIEVLFAGETDLISFAAEADVSEDPGNPAAAQGQLHTLLAQVEGAIAQAPFASFFDEDGEQVALRVKAIALLTVPHTLLWADEISENVTDPSSPPRRPQLTLLDGGR